MIKNANIGKYGYSGYGIGFDRKPSFSFPSGGFSQDVIIFGVDMSSFAHIDNKKKDILVLGKGPTQRLDHTLTTKFCLSLHYNGANGYLFVNGTEIIKFKVKDSEIVAAPLCFRKHFKRLVSR